MPVLVAAVFALAAGSGSRAPQPSAAEKARLDVVYSAIDTRMTNQQNIWFKAGRYITVLQSLKIQYALNPSSYDIATNFAWMYENIKEDSQALKIYDQFRRNNKNNPNAAEPEALFYYRKRQIAKIPAILEPTIHGKVKPGPNIYRLLAHAYDRLGKLDDSIRVYKAYLKLQPKDATAIQNLKRVEAKKAKSQQKPGKGG